MSKRLLYLVLILITIPLGLGSRYFRSDLPYLVAQYGGDVLSATCIFFGVRFVALHSSLARVFAISYLVCVLIELQQLWRAPWLVQLRDETPLGILLGHSFLWSDLVCYFIGVIIGLLISIALEHLLRRQLKA